MNLTLIKVVDLTRECQYCWDTDLQGRVRCGRLAYTANPIRVGNKVQITFRCKAHQGKRNDSTLMFTQTFHSLNQDLFFGLGYKP